MTTTKTGKQRSYCAVCGDEKETHLPTSEGLEFKAHEFKARAKGFAAMSRERVQEIARSGAKAAHAAGTVHQFTPEEARIAGRKGGLSTTQKHGAVGGRRSGRNVAEIPPLASASPFPSDEAKTDVVIMQPLPEDKTGT